MFSHRRSVKNVSWTQPTQPRVLPRYTSVRIICAAEHWRTRNNSLSSLFILLVTRILNDKGFLQGCYLSPTVFKIFIFSALPKRTKKCQVMGLQINGSYLYTLLFCRWSGGHSYRHRLANDELKNGVQSSRERSTYLVIYLEDKNLSIEERVINCCEILNI